MMKKMMGIENIGPALRGVLSRINEAAEKRPQDVAKVVPRLVAVSKTKPVDHILEAYQHGQRHFGENYVQELARKASDPRLNQLRDLKWHFIGHLQRNKCNNLTAIPNLYMVETINSERLAASLNNSWGKVNKQEPLRVMVEVNTSNEETKKGCQSEECLSLVNFITQHCPYLKFVGIMTIGQYDYDWETLGPNPDFLCLMECHRDICHKLNKRKEEIEISMGMSADFDKAVIMGSTSVRVGSTIFGLRDPKLKQPNISATSKPDAGNHHSESGSETNQCKDDVGSRISSGMEHLSLA